MIKRTFNPNGKHKLCIITGLHGNEAFLFRPLVNCLEKMELEDLSIEIILANEKAARKNVRFIDEDLNRCFDKGLKETKTHEQKIMKTILKSVNGDLILDLHTHSSEEKFCLLPEKNLNKNMEQFICSINIDNCIIVSPEVTKRQSLIEQFENAVSIEVGKHCTKNSVSFAIECVENAVSHLSRDSKAKSNKVNFLKAERFIFNQESHVVKTNENIKNFVQVTSGTKITENLIADEDFVPVLVSRKAKPHEKIFLKCHYLEKGDKDG